MNMKSSGGRARLDTAKTLVPLDRLSLDLELILARSSLPSDRRYARDRRTQVVR
jgi:hypothetical protein